MIVYQIKDWEAHFETHQERRKYKGKLPWVRIPTASNLAYRRLMRLDGGTTAYGVFIALVRVAATCPVRGLLERDGKALTAYDIEDLTDIPFGLVESAVAILSDARIGWLVEGCASAQNGDISAPMADISAPSVDISALKPKQRGDGAEISPNLRDRREEKRREENRIERERASEADEDIFNDAPSGELTDRELIRPIAAFVSWKSRDPDRQADALAEVAALVHSIGGTDASRIASDLSRSLGRKSWANEFADACLAAQRVEPTEPVPLTIAERRAKMAQSYPEAREAYDRLERFGAERVFIAMGFSENITLDKFQDIISESYGHCVEINRITKDWP